MHTPSRVLRSIAVFEAFKGFLAVIGALGYLSLMHHDIHRLALELIGHMGANPTDHYPALFIRWADDIAGSSVQSVLLLAAGYSLIRFLEAFGIWRDESWGEWLAATSGMIYIPFEVGHLIREPGWISVMVLGVNLALVIYLAWVLYQKRSTRYEIH
jgi:uncharacterized membrane protein (DUF2068 family)